MSDEKKVVKVKAKPAKVTAKPVAAPEPVVAPVEPEVTKSLFEEPSDAVWSKEAREGNPGFAAKRPPKRRQTLAAMPETLEPEKEPVRIAKEKPVEAPAPAEPAEPAKPEAAAKKPSEKPAGYVPFYKKVWFWLLVTGLALALIALVLQDRNSGGTTNVTSISVTSVQPTTAGQNATVPGSVSVDDANQTLTVTLPADFFAGSTREDIIAEAEAEGFDGCVVNSDGSVTYTMNREKQASMLSDFKREIDNSITNLTNGSTSYRSIIYNEGVTQFDVRVDKDAFAASETDQGYAAALFMLGGYYQMFSGVPNDRVDVILNLIDDANGQTIGAVTYQEAMAGI